MSCPIIQLRVISFTCCGEEDTVLIGAGNQHASYTIPFSDLPSTQLLQLKTFFVGGHTPFSTKDNGGDVILRVQFSFSVRISISTPIFRLRGQAILGECTHPLIDFDRPLVRFPRIALSLARPPNRNGKRCLPLVVIRLQFSPRIKISPLFRIIRPDILVRPFHGKAKIHGIRPVRLGRERFDRAVISSAVDYHEGFVVVLSLIGKTGNRRSERVIANWLGNSSVSQLVFRHSPHKAVRNIFAHHIGDVERCCQFRGDLANLLVGGFGSREHGSHIAGSKLFHLAVELFPAYLEYAAVLVGLARLESGYDSRIVVVGIRLHGRHSSGAKRNIAGPLRSILETSRHFGGR